MKILTVTPMLPHPGAGTAQALVMHAQLAGLIAHHEITVARFAGLDPGEAAKVWVRRRVEAEQPSAP